MSAIHAPRHSNFDVRSAIDCSPAILQNEKTGYMKFTSHIIVTTNNYDSYMLNRKGTEPKKRRLNLHIIELLSSFQIMKGFGYERDKKYIEHNTGDLNAVILHFRAGVQSDNI